MKWKSQSKKRKPATQRDDLGRLHLLVHHDPTTRTAKTSLRAPLFQEAWQNALVTTTADAALNALALSPSLPTPLKAPPRASLPAVIHVSREATAAHERIVSNLFARAPKAKVACKAGCDHCCYQSVGVTPVEALSIAEHLQTALTTPELLAVRSRLQSARERTRGLTAEERYSPKYPCPFLNAGQCGIYEVRPLSCRGANSLDAAECERSLHDPVARAEFIAKGGGRSYLEPIRAFHAISAGLQLAFSEVYQLDMRPLDLVAALDTLLTDVNAGSQWLQRQPTLTAALGGERVGEANDG